MGIPLEQLWRQRSSAFWKEMLPYFRYMAQSGFPGFAILLFIVAMIGYGMLLRDVPPGFPIITCGVLLLTPLISYSPLRTWLRSPDLVFLMPREARMKPYILRSLRYNSVAGLAFTFIALLIYLPLYRNAPDAQPIAVLAVIVLALKLGNMAGAWRERQMAWNAARRTMRLVRWVLTALVVAAAAQVVWWQAAGFLALVALLVAVLYRLPARHAFPWERLIEEEGRTHRRYLMFLSAFIDVPTLSARTSRRRYLAWAAKRVPYNKSHTYTYLYGLTLARAEVGGMLMRMGALGALSVLLAGWSQLFQGWGTAAVGLLFVFIAGVQSGALRQVHQFTVWKQIYPLPEQGNHQALVRVARFAHAIIAGMLWLVVAATSLPYGLYWPVAAAGVLYAWEALYRRPRALMKRLHNEEDES